MADVLLLDNGKKYIDSKTYFELKDKLHRRDMQIKDLKKKILKDKSDLKTVLDLFSNTDLTNRNANDVIEELRQRINR